MPESNMLPPPPSYKKGLPTEEERIRDLRIAEYEFVLANLKRMEEANNKPEKEHILGYN